MVSAMNGFIAGTVFIWPAGGNGGIQPPAVCVGRLGAGGLRLIPMWVCASHPGKTYSSVEGRKLFAGERRRRLCGFAPHTSESLISPLRGENLLPGRGASGRVSLRLTPGKALFFRRGAQTGFPGAGAELVHGTPQSHDFPFPLHQVVGLFRRLTASELVHGTP